MVNPDMAAKFLDLLDTEPTFTFQTFPDAEAGPWPCVLHGSFAQHQERLTELNEKGAGVFVMVNAGDGQVHDGSKTCRTANNVVRVRALFVDLDGAPIAPVLASDRVPDWVVQSSPGRWHAYWIVDDCSLEQFGRAQSALAKRFGGDPSVKDLPRVMRVPGFVHRKGEPFLSQVYLPQGYAEMRSQDHAG